MLRSSDTDFRVLQFYIFNAYISRHRISGCIKLLLITSPDTEPLTWWTCRQLSLVSTAAGPSTDIMIPFPDLILMPCKICRKVREGLPKKVAVLLDFVQLRGVEGPAQILCPLFTNCIYWVNLQMGREGETPAQIFWHIFTICNFGLLLYKCKCFELSIVF